MTAVRKGSIGKQSSPIAARYKANVYENGLNAFCDTIDIESLTPFAIDCN
jgi:hypothetical protein